MSTASPGPPSTHRPGPPWVSDAICAAVEPDPLGEERDVDAPLVLAAAARARPVDHDLAGPHRDRQRAAQLVAPPPVHRGRHRQVAHERPEQPDRRHARRHHRRQLRRDRRLVRRLERRDAGLGGVIVDMRAPRALRFAFRSDIGTLSIRYPKRKPVPTYDRASPATHRPPRSPAARPRLDRRPAAHGRPRPARPPLGAARAVGAPRPDRSGSAPSRRRATPCRRACCATASPS